MKIFILLNNIEPIGQGRARASINRGRFRKSRIIMRDPLKSRSWKQTVSLMFKEEMRVRGYAPLEGAIRMLVVAIFSCPKSSYRKNKPREKEAHTKKPDNDNILKIIKDAGNGILYHDDRQIFDSTIIKYVGAQGERPSIQIRLENEIENDIFKGVLEWLHPKQ